MKKLKQELVQDKIMDVKTLTNLVEGWRIKGQKIVFTNGCFDILHHGHVALLLQAAELGNRLVLGINTDSSVKKLKGESRPINNEASRALILAAQLYVDAVVLFDEDTPFELIQALKPDVLLKGGDYTPETVVGNDFVKTYGGETVIIPLVDGFSTTGLIEKMKY